MSTKCMFCGSGEAVRREACQPCLDDEAAQDEQVAEYDGRREQEES